jgi:ABC-type ATPase involved in cell division
MLAELRGRGCTIVVATHDVEMFRQARSELNSLKVDAVYSLVNGMITPG